MLPARIAYMRTSTHNIILNARVLLFTTQCEPICDSLD